MRVTFSSLLLALVSACNFPRPADVGGETGPGDASSPADASASVDTPAVDAPPVDAPPGVTIHVSLDGDDANDGATNPVKTLKRAIGIAATSHATTMIAMAAGRYGAATGEVFPATVPPNVIVSGPAGGGAILVGTNTEFGLIIDTGTLRELEFENFAVAIIARDLAELVNIRVRASGTAVREATTAQLSLNKIDITGTSGSCSNGIELSGNAELSGTDLTARGLGTSLLVQDQSTFMLARATIGGEMSCQVPILDITSSKTISLSESMLDTGHIGIRFAATGALTQATLTDVVIRNMRQYGIIGDGFVLQMAGGEVSNGGNIGIAATNGSWSLTNVAVKQNPVTAIFGRDGALTMRGCNVVGSFASVELDNPGSADLGTALSPGNNTLQNSGNGMGLHISAATTTSGVAQAVGNTWLPSTQGANNQGKYSAMLIPGPISYVDGNNFSISVSGWSLQL
jgi:hypothetical protein